MIKTIIVQVEVPEEFITLPNFEHWFEFHAMKDQLGLSIVKTNQRNNFHMSLPVDGKLEKFEFPFLTYVESNEDVTPVEFDGEELIPDNKSL